jgi:tRNA threonylcarbamoyladenosine biosynthesis protein TsaB
VNASAGGVLAIETSTTTGSVAVVFPDRLVAEITLDTRLSHGERLLGAIDRVLRDAGLAVADLAGIAVSAGPGSFTGLRVGLATAKGIAEAHPLRLAAVPTLEALAFGAAPWASGAGSGMAVLAALDAKKEEVYGALFRWDEARARFERLLEEGAFRPGDLARRVASAAEGPIVLLGDGVTAYRGVFEGALGSRARFVPAPAHQPRAAWVGWLGLERFRRGEIVDPVTLAPRYCRPSEAELARARREREAGEGRRTPAGKNL